MPVLPPVPHARRAPPPRRLLAGRLSPAALAARARAVLRAIGRLWPFVLPTLLAAALGAMGVRLWSERVPWLAPRHRAEALCFALAGKPAFSPPMPVVPSAALVRGRFTAGTPAGVALRDVMHFAEEQVIEERRVTVGDYDVTVLWLRLTDPPPARPWLIVGWMEGGDLAVCNFRFARSDPSLDDQTRYWGRRLLDRILRPEYFRAGTLPAVRLRATHGDDLPSFGPPIHD